MICEVSALKQNAFIIPLAQTPLYSAGMRRSQAPAQEGLGQMTHREWSLAVLIKFSGSGPEAARC